MIISNKSLSQPTERNVFIVMTRRTASGGALHTFSNRQVVMQWIKNEGGICYIETNGTPVLLDKYGTLARRLLKENSIFITIIPPGNNVTPVKYEIIKSPLIKQY